MKRGVLGFVGLWLKVLFEAHSVLSPNQLRPERRLLRFLPSNDDAAVKRSRSVTSSRCSSVVEARLLRFWEARNETGGELMWMDLLTVDVNVCFSQTLSRRRRFEKLRFDGRKILTVAVVLVSVTLQSMNSSTIPLGSSLVKPSSRDVLFASEA